MSLILALCLSSTAALADAGTEYEACSQICIDVSNECFSQIDADSVNDTLEACQNQGGCDPQQAATIRGQMLSENALQCSLMLSTCIDDCAKQTGGDANYSLQRECPEGTVPNLLGVCSPTIGAPPTDTSPDDGCPAAHHIGPTGACEPDLDVVVSSDVFRAGDDWVVSCPPGTRAGPVDGCVADLSDASTDESTCPAGMIEGPDGACVPDHGSTLGRDVLIESLQALGDFGLLQSEHGAALLQRYDAVGTTDPTETCADVAAFAADLADF